MYIKQMIALIHIPEILHIPEIPGSCHKFQSILSLGAVEGKSNKVCGIFLAISCTPNDVAWGRLFRHFSRFFVLALLENFV